MNFSLSYQPGEQKSATLVAIGGNQVIRGGNGIADGPVDDSKLKEVMEAVHSRGFGDLEEKDARYTLSNLSNLQVCIDYCFFICYDG